MLPWTIFVYGLNQGCNHFNNIIINGMSSGKPLCAERWYMYHLLVVSPILIWCLKPLKVPSAAKSFVLFWIHQCLIPRKLAAPFSCLAIRYSLQIVSTDWRRKEEGKREHTHTHTFESRGWLLNFPLRCPVFLFHSLWSTRWSTTHVETED